jgi:hypothetical protein
MLRGIRGVAVTLLAMATLSLSGFVRDAPAAQAAGVIDCVVQPQPPKGACYEPVWVDGQQVTMIFPQQGNPVHTVPSAKQQNFYVVGPQTDTAQGETPGFFHDHVVEAAPGDPGFTPFMHGYLVLCSQEGISTGGCTFNIETPPGGSPLPLAKSVTGFDLTTAEGIQVAANAGLVVLVDTGAVFRGVVAG